MNQEVSYQNIAPLYDQIYGSDEEHTKNELDALLTLLNKRNIQISNSIVVDLGGGTGRIAFPLSKLCKKLILADLFAQMIEIAKQKQYSCEHGEIVSSRRFSRIILAS